MDPGLDILHILQDFRLSMPSSVDSFFLMLSSPVMYIMLPLCLGAMLLWFSGKQKGEIVLFTFMAAIGISRTVKLIVKQPRPWVLDPTIQPSEEAMATARGYSLPSGHTTFAVSSYGAFAAVVKSWILKIAAVILVILIPFSRLYLCVHTPLDVAVGVIIAVFFCVFNLKAVPWSYRSERNRSIFLIGYLAYFIITAVFVALSEESPTELNYMGMAFGLVIGTFLEERYIHYEVRKRPLKKNVAIGAAGLVIMGIMFGVPYLLFGWGIGVTIGGLLCMLTATLLCPYLIKRYDESSVPE